jgi:3',5'-cyclic AMP phosphodiesterase CpdA
MQQHFAHLSDPHLSSLAGVKARDLISKRALGYLSWRRRRRFEHRREVLTALELDLQQFHLDQLLVTGDLTHIGLPQEFQQARDWLQQLGKPHDVALIPGNHDACVAADWQQTFALWQEYMASDAATTGADPFPSLRVRGDIAFIGLSTACPKPPLMATGTVGALQLAQLPALLGRSAARGLFRVVYLHHCPVPGKEKWRKRLTDASAVQQVIIDHGAELVLHGHGHRVHYNELSTTHGTTPVVAVPSASSMGLRGGTAAQYNCYRVNRCDRGWELQISSRGYRPDTDEFIDCGRREVRLKRS